jgi:hypothetical protein
MGALCSIADVEALLGAPIPADRLPATNRLIELASAIVADACRPLPTDTTPDSVAAVTATLVVRQYTNPSMTSSESLQGFRAGYPAYGLVMTPADREALGDWANTGAGKGAGTMFTPSRFAYGPDETFGDGWPIVVVGP